MNNYYFTATKEFKTVLRKIYLYNSSINNIYSSNKLQKTLIQKIKIQKTFPKMYPIYNQKEQLRKIPIEKYIIIYQVKKKDIHFVDIIPTKSNRYNNLY